MAKEFSFNDLDEQLTKINPKGSVISINSYSRIDEWISSGNYLLNAQFSGSLFGGIPNSRSVCLAGESGCLPKNERVKVYVMKTQTFDERQTIQE